ncbi:MAG TPA: TetR/AcrR family transcriptional regulator [Solirubrobacteraceae bacterium]
MSEVQRGRLLAAAGEVVAEVGYAGMSMARVTSRAGVARGTFYELFEDREDCFLAVFDDAVDMIAAVAVPGYESEQSWGEKVRAGLSALLVFIGDERGLGSLLVVDALSAGPRVLERRAQWLETLASIVDRGRLEVKRSREPVADLGRSALTAEGVVGAVLSVLHARLLERDDGSLVGLCNELMALIVLPYLGRRLPGGSLRVRCPERVVRRPGLRDLRWMISIYASRIARCVSWRRLLSIRVPVIVRLRMGLAFETRRRSQSSSRGSRSSG